MSTNTTMPLPHDFSTPETLLMHILCTAGYNREVSKDNCSDPDFQIDLYCLAADCAIVTILSHNPEL